MECIVTAGPSWEPLDQVRRLTNFSTGKLGSELAGFLAGQGHGVRLLIGEGATYARRPAVRRVELFTTTDSLAAWLRDMAGEPVDAVFHVAALSDFQFGKVWERLAEGELREVQAGKISSRLGNLVVELVPTTKVIGNLRRWHPRACLVGWKYEVQGGREEALSRAEEQIRDCKVDATVANGPAYGEGFGLVRAGGGWDHFGDAKSLYEGLEAFAKGVVRDKAAEG